MRSHDIHFQVCLGGGSSTIRLPPPIPFPLQDLFEEGEGAWQPESKLENHKEVAGAAASPSTSME